MIEKFKIIGLYVSSFILISAISGCEVFVDFGLKSSTFELYESRIPGNELNMLTLMLPGYQPDNPDFRYIVKYFDNDRCAGDTLQYTVEGTWTLPEPDVLRMNLDQFVDADFKITKLDKVTYLLKSEANAHGLPIEPPTTPLHMYNRKLH